VLAGTACAGAGAASAQSYGTAPPSVKGPACRPPELRALFRGFRASGGALIAAVVVTNSGSQPCWLSGTPQSVTLLDESGATVTVRSRPLAVPAGAGPVELVPGASLPAFGAPPTRGSAWFLVTWSNWCASASPSVQSLLVVLPAGGSVAAPVDTAVPGWAQGPAAPRCDDPRSGSTVSISRFQAPGTA
jgi:hypothetical protein